MKGLADSPRDARGELEQMLEGGSLRATGTKTAMKSQFPETNGPRIKPNHEDENHEQEPAQDQEQTSASEQLVEHI